MVNSNDNDKFNNNRFLKSLNAHNQQQVAREKIYTAGVKLSEALEELNGGTPIPFNLIVWGNEVMHITNIQESAREEVEQGIVTLMQSWKATFPNDGQ